MAYYRGVNVSGGEFGSSWPGTYGSTYIYNTQATYDFLAGRGIKLIRLCLRWENVQQTLNGALDTTEVNRIKQQLDYIYNSDLLAVIEPHNTQCRYMLSGTNYQIGSTQVPISAFTDFWTRMSTAFKGYHGLWAYGLINEPASLDGGATDWENISQQALTAIRNNSDTTRIIVPGYSWSGAWTWTTNHPDPWITDPASNFIYEAHQYFDNDGSGSYNNSYATENANAVSQGYTDLADRSVHRLQTFTDWLDSNGITEGMLGEFGWPNNESVSSWNAVGEAIYDHLDTHNLHATMWSVGRWWGSYKVAPYWSSDSTNVDTVKDQASVLEAHPSTETGAVTIEGTASGTASGMSAALTTPPHIVGAAAGSGTTAMELTTVAEYPIIALDDFQRSDTATGWGTSTNTEDVTNYAWASDGSGANVKITSHAGVNIGTSDYGPVLDDGTTRNTAVEILTEQSTSSLSAQMGNLLAVSGGSNFGTNSYRIHWYYSVSQFRIRRCRGGAMSTPASISFTPTLNTHYYIKSRITSSGASRRIQAKIWATTDSEPAWQLDWTDTDPVPVGRQGVIIGTVANATHVWSYRLTDLSYVPPVAIAGTSSGSAAASSATLSTPKVLTGLTGAGDGDAGLYTVYTNPPVPIAGTAAGSASGASNATYGEGVYGAGGYGQSYSLTAAITINQRLTDEHVSGSGSAQMLLTVEDIPPFEPPTEPLEGPGGKSFLPIAARYAIRIRDNNRVLRDQLHSFKRLSIVKRFNGVSDWAIELDSLDPIVSTLTTPGYGIAVTRTLYRLTSYGEVLDSRIEISGPMTDISRSMKDNTITVHGKDDLIWLQNRLAYPITTAPDYAGYADDLTDCVRYLRLNETAGSTATDTKGVANASYGGSGNLLNQPNGLDETAGVLKTNGSGYVVGPGTSCPTGNGAWTLSIWARVSTWTIGQRLAAFGLNSTTHGTASFRCLDVGGGVPGIAIDNNGLASTPFTAPTDDVWHHYVATYNGTDCEIFMDAEGKTVWTPAGGMAIPAPASCYVAVAGSALATPGNLMAGSFAHLMIFTRVLSDEEIVGLYRRGRTRFHAGAYDIKSGVAETIIRDYVDHNAGANATTDRQVAGLTQSTDSGFGSKVYGTVRFDRLINKDGTGILQLLGIAGGVGYKIDLEATDLVFKVYLPTDRTATTRFSGSLGNLIDYTYTKAAPPVETGGNVCIVGGQGELTDRIFQIMTDSSSVATWWRAESFRDARDTNDIAVMQQRGAEALAEGASTSSFSAVLSQGPKTIYGVDFDLGDKVTVVVDGLVWEDLVREVELTLTPDQPEQVTPKVGTPNAQFVDDALVQYRREAQRTASYLAKLERRR